MYKEKKVANRILYLGLGVGLLVTLAFIGGCAPSQQAPAQGQSSNWMSIVFILLILGAFIYVMIIRPWGKHKEHQQMTQELKRGDKVITTTGMYGEIESISDDSIVIKVESGATVRMAENSIAGLREKRKSPSTR